MVIRRSNPQDMSKISEIWLQASLFADEGLPAAFWWHRQETVRKQMEDGSELWVADENDQLVGFVAMKADELIELYVDPSYQSQSLAEALLHLVKRNYPVVRHRAYAEHPEEIAFYEQHGFRIKESQIHPVWHVEELLMECGDP